MSVCGDCVAGFWIWAAGNDFRALKGARFGWLLAASTEVMGVGVGGGEGENGKDDSGVDEGERSGCFTFT